jgi:hypothetical protein
MSINSAKLDSYVLNEYNALFVGPHGVGKTANVLDCFKRHGLTYAYFSCATLDPWVDFIGIPKEKQDPNGHSYIELIKPRAFAEDKVQAIFFDEFNRSPKKVRNACMELIQFKSINGHKLNNLKIIWAAINPEDDEETYDVEKLDPAQVDRFHVRVEVPSKPDKTWFNQKYGEAGANACDWWQEMPKEQQKLVSPRRLDYAVDAYARNMDLKDVLNNGVNIQKLIQELKNGSYRKQLEKLVETGTPVEIQAKLAEENFFNSTLQYIIESKEYMETLAQYIPHEKFINCISTDKKFIDAFTGAVKDPLPFKDILATTPASTIAKAKIEKWKQQVDFSKATVNTGVVGTKLITDPWLKECSNTAKNQTGTPDRIKLLTTMADKNAVAGLSHIEFKQYCSIFESICKSLQTNTLSQKCGIAVNAICKIMQAEYTKRFAGTVPPSLPDNLSKVIAEKNSNGTAFTFWTEPATFAEANKLANNLLTQLTGGKNLPKTNLVPAPAENEANNKLVTAILKDKDDTDDIPF